jgi:hypothetical protein
MSRHLVITLCFAAIGTVAHAQSAPAPAGRWEGEIQMPGKPLGLVVDIDRSGTGWIGSLTIPMTTTVDVPIERISVENTAVHFTAKLPGDTTFEGTLSADARQLAGMASNALGGVPFQLVHKGAANVKVPAVSSLLTRDFEGVWEGAIEASGRTIRARITLSPGPDGRATATLVNLEQATETVPVTTVTLDGNAIHLDVRVVSGTYRGALTAAGEISGEWSQGAASAPLTLRRPAAR